MDFVELDRRFYLLSDSEVEDPDLLATLADRSFLKAEGWPQILTHGRVVILSEAGSGKTAEMRQQARRLQAEGTPSFFVALEQLANKPLEALLSKRENRAFRAWKRNDRSVAWFFLDAVDELKLVFGKLETALSQLARETDGLLHRMRVIISCRPSDWRQSVDYAALRSILPITPPEPLTKQPREDIFVAALENQVPSRKQDPNEAESDAPRIVFLLPLDEEQIGTFAQALGVADAATLVAELKKQDAVIFARRPLDLVELAAVWRAKRRLGTRVEQHDANVMAKLTDDPDRRDRGVLHDSRARDGAERLALALALTQTRTVRSPDQALEAERMRGVLDAQFILVDWSPEERQSLLRRAVFDPATYGRVRFHHQSVVEYLAAKRLTALRARGLPTKVLLRLLFAEPYEGVSVIVPSMRPIVAWLSLWDSDVFREAVLREPEVLVTMGDPEALPVPKREEVLRAFVRKYHDGHWRGLDLPIGEVRRLAHPALAREVRRLWREKPLSEDAVDLLLLLIWQGAMTECADIAEEAALDDSLPSHDRDIAVRALLASDRVDAALRIGKSLTDEAGRWPSDSVPGIAGVLFPLALSPGQLVALMEAVPEPRRTTGGFAWQLRQTAQRLDPLSPSTTDLRDRVAELIWRSRKDDQISGESASRFDYLAPGLALLCNRQLDVSETVSDPNLVRACAVACRFGRRLIGGADIVDALRMRFRDDVALRERAFWADLNLTDSLNPTDEVARRLYQAQDDGLLRQLDQLDRPWLETALIEQTDTGVRQVVLLALIRLWDARGRRGRDLSELRERTSDEPGLTELLRAWTVPPTPNPAVARWEAARRRREARQRKEAKRYLASWKRWRVRLRAKPHASFSSRRRPSTVRNLYTWLRAYHRDSNHFNVWSREALTGAFGQQVVKLAVRAFGEAWRAETPAMWSERALEERNSIPESWILGLCGIAAEAESPGWASRLQPEEAWVAAAYAPVEMNGFPVWLGDLVAAQPEAVDDVLGRELQAELGLTTKHNYLPVLQNSAFGEVGLKRLLAPRALASLASWPTTFENDEAGQNSALALDNVLRLLDDGLQGEGRALATTECQKRIRVTRSGPLAVLWLRGLFRFDPVAAARTFEDTTSRLPEGERSPYAVAMLGGVFGDHGVHIGEFSDDTSRATTCGRLVRCAYAFVRHEDDREHDGVYTPDARDHAQRARGLLLSALLDTPGLEARRQLLELARLHPDRDFIDRLRHLTRERAAKDAQPTALSPADVVALESRYEVPPHDRDSLFQVMIDRLEDLQHDIAHDDFSDRCVLSLIRDEADMQRTIARRLRDAARGAYVVTREEEVAESKRTDIRLVAADGVVKAAIEIKIIDNDWSISDLERALRVQLVKQYLRHESCQIGCFLLTYHGAKRFWQHPKTHARLDYAAVLTRLEGQARSIEKSLGTVRLRVLGLDLRAHSAVEPAAVRRAGRRGKPKRSRR